jgi:DNA-binding transcriptional ArsR family regulator
MLELPEDRRLKRLAPKDGRKAARGRAHALRPEQIQASSSLLKAIANENRLTILYLLREGEKSVLELGRSLDLRQPTVSQHLARLREEGIVTTRRDGQAIYYSLVCRKARRIIDLVERLYT